MKMPRIRIILLLSLLITALINGCHGAHNHLPLADKIAKTHTTQHDHNQHQHGTIEIHSLDANAAIPSVKLNIQADTMNGWNVQLITKNFRFTPEKVNHDPVAGEGHAHLTIDGYKWARVYSQWLHVKNLTPGKHVFEVKLNANNHSAFSHKGVIISDSHEVTQSST